MYKARELRENMENSIYDAKRFLNSYYGIMNTNFNSYIDTDSIKVIKENNMQREFIVLHDDIGGKTETYLVFTDAITAYTDGMIYMNDRVLSVTESMAEISKMLHNLGII